MKPGFGTPTKILAGVFVWAAIGSGQAGLEAGHQTTPGTGGFGAILILLSIACLAVGTGIWMEWLWAWWAGLAVVVAVVAEGLASRSLDGGWLPYVVFLILFVVSGVRGWRTEQWRRQNL